MLLPLLLTGSISPVVFTGLEWIEQEPVGTDEQSQALAENANVMPMRLQDLVLLVSQNAPAIRQARLAALGGEGGVVESGGIFDPVFFADLTYSYAEQPTSGIFSTFFPETETKTWTANQGIRGMLLSGATYSVNLREQTTNANYLATDQADVSLSGNFTQPLLRGGWELVNEFNRRTAELNRDKGYESVRQTSVDTVQAAIDAYWDLTFAIEDVKVKEFGLSLAEAQRKETEARFRVGSVAEVEVVQTLAQIASRTDALLTARNTVKQAQDRLRLLVFGLEEASEWDIYFQPISDVPEAVSTDLVWQDAFATALEQRSDLVQLALDLQQADLAWKVATKNTDPRLDLVLNGNSNGQDERIGSAFTPVGQIEYPGYSIGLVFELPFGNRTYMGAEQRLRASYLLAQQQLKDTEKTVASEVRDAVRSVNYLAQRVEATAKSSFVAERQLDAEQRRLREGVSTNFQVLSFQNDLLTAKTTELGARIAYAKAVTRLKTVQGLHWDGQTAQPPQYSELNEEAERVSEDQ
ncbi:MAG: TolC family protein [Planctomycetes bacterium]|nr:TolC family protein [Planctomycetota bacterium]